MLLKQTRRPHEYNTPRTLISPSKQGLQNYWKLIYGLLTMAKLTRSLKGAKDTDNEVQHDVIITVPPSPLRQLRPLNLLTYGVLKASWTVNRHQIWKTLASYEVRGIICVLVWISWLLVSRFYSWNLPFCISVYTPDCDYATCMWQSMAICRSSTTAWSVIPSANLCWWIEANHCMLGRDIQNRL